VKSNYTPRPTDPRDVAAAQAQEKQRHREREALDRELIRRMEEGPMLDIDHIPWAELEEYVARLAASKPTQK
jgi:hypothetical protein